MSSWRIKLLALCANVVFAACCTNAARSQTSAAERDVATDQLHSRRVLPELSCGWIVYPSKNVCGHFVVPNWLGLAAAENGNLLRIKSPIRVRFDVSRYYSPATNQYGDRGLLYAPPHENAHEQKFLGGVYVTSGGKTYDRGVFPRTVTPREIVDDTHQNRFVPAMLLGDENNQAPSVVLKKIGTYQILRKFAIQR